MLKKILHVFNDKPIFFRFSFIIITVLAGMTSLSILNIYTFTSEKKAATFHMVNQTNHHALSKIDDYLIDISNITIIPLTYKQKDKTYLRNLEEFNSTNNISLSFQKMSEQMFEEILAYKKTVDSCFVFNLSGIGDYKIRTPIYKSMNPINEPWFQESIDLFGKPRIIDTYELPYVSNNKGPVYVFGVSRGIVRFESSSVIGILLVNTKIDFFRDIARNIEITPGHRIMILHDDYVIYDTKEENIATIMQSEVSDINWDSNITEHTLDIDGNPHIAISLLSDYSGWRLISLIPHEELFHELKQLQISTILICILLIIVSLLMVFLVTSQIVYPLKRLALLMKIAESGDFSVKININSNDEIGDLSKSFNSMTSTIDNLIQEVYVEQIKKSELELQMLQSQINPHFIYNTLESISMMAIIHDDNTTSDMASNLGSILRYGINNKEEVTVSEEIENLRRYVYLQDIRFHNVYTVSIHVDPSLYVISTIKLILQPIVENAIYHGMKEIRTGGLIEVHGYKYEKNILIFEINDNGNGMSDYLVKDLNDYINDKNNLFNSIGLRNVNKRIKLRYGKDYGLTIQSSIDMGTKVIVRIPIESK